MKLFNILTLACLLAFSSMGFAAESININTADVVTLEKQMQGVGKTRAEAIIAYRDKNGPFSSIDELAKVEGIGNRTVELNRSKLVLK